MLFDQLPWDTREITLYYLGTRKEISFARANVLGVPNVHLERYERKLTDADVAVLMQVMEVSALGPDVAEGSAIETVAYVETEEIDVGYDEALGTQIDLENVDPDDPLARAEAAAMRSDIAAERVEAAAASAEAAALRAEKAFDRLAASVPNAAR